MDGKGPDLDNLQVTQVDSSGVTHVHLRDSQEDIRMLKPEVVDRIRELSGQGLGSKRIARELGVSRNSVRRYLAGATVGFQERFAARRLDDPTLSEVDRLLSYPRRGKRCCHSAGAGQPRGPRRPSDPATGCGNPPPGGAGQSAGHSPVRDSAGSTDPDRLR